MADDALAEQRSLNAFSRLIGRRKRGREAWDSRWCHFEVVGKDGEKLQGYYAELFDWNVDASNEMKYGLVDREANSKPKASASAAASARAPRATSGHVTFYVEVPSVEEALSKAESLGGTRVMGPETIMGRMVLGQLKDPEGNVIGLIEGGS